MFETVVFHNFLSGKPRIDKITREDKQGHSEKRDNAPVSSGSRRRRVERPQTPNFTYCGNCADRQNYEIYPHSPDDAHAMRRKRTLRIEQ
jgi:hypothetical protein